MHANHEGDWMQMHDLIYEQPSHSLTSPYEEEFSAVQFLLFQRSNSRRDRWPWVTGKIIRPRLHGGKIDARESLKCTH